MDDLAPLNPRQSAQIGSSANPIRLVNQGHNRFDLLEFPISLGPISDPYGAFNGLRDPGDGMFDPYGCPGSAAGT